MNTVTSQDFADVISLKIVNSNKKYDEVATKAFHNHILKEYHQFVYGVLNKDCLKMFITHNAFVSDEYGEDEEGNCGLTGKIEVHASVSEPSVFTHELGHFVDHLLSPGHKTFSYNLVIKDGKTLNEIINEELNMVSKQVHKMLFDKYKKIIDETLGEKSFDILMNNFYKYQKLCNTDPNDHITRWRLQDELYEAGFVDTYYELSCNDYLKEFGESIIPVADALSSKYKLQGYYLPYHDYDYYQIGNFHLGSEFFANMFDYKISNYSIYYEDIKKYLPRSFEAFDLLFDIVYDFLMKNKDLSEFCIK